MGIGLATRRMWRAERWDVGGVEKGGKIENKQGGAERATGRRAAPPARKHQLI